MLVGEAHGQTEDETGKPFAGESGKELFRMLGEAWPHIAPGLHRDISSRLKYASSWLDTRDEWLAEASVLMTNVLAFRPPDNKIDYLCGDKSSAGPAYPYPPISRANYLRAEYFGEIERLQTEISTVCPNIVVALGNTACWATLKATNIGSIRGTVASADVPIRLRSVGDTNTGLHCAGDMLLQKILPSYHPAAVLRQWSWRPIVVTDLIKAERESHWPEIRRPERQVLISPTLEQLEAWTSDCLSNPPPFLASDTETGAGQIKCIGFARSRSDAIVIPFVDLAHGGSYWPLEWQELAAWKCVQRLLESPIPKVFQNGMYDYQYILKTPIRPRNLLHDTMLLHHSLFPELQKGLGFLGSIYSNEASWKLMARKRKDDELKRDE